MKRLDTARLEKRFASVVQIGDRQADALIGDRIPMQIESHAQVLREAIRGIKRPDGIATDQQHDAAVSEFYRFEQILLRSERFC